MSSTLLVLLLLSSFFYQSIKSFDCTKDWQHTYSVQPHDGTLIAEHKRVIGTPNIIFQYGSYISLPQYAAYKSVVALAGRIWQSLLNDAVTVNITVDVAPLGSNILGQTSSNYLAVAYDTLVSQLSAKINQPDLVFPSASTFSADVPGPGLGRLGSVYMTQANARALNFAPRYLLDAGIKISANFSFDVNPYDGVSSSTTDLLSVMVHEIGHMLGFVSILDSVNGYNHPIAYTYNPCILDLYRFSANVSTFSFTNTQRALNENSTYEHVLRESASRPRPKFSKGSYLRGDGFQPEHWKHYTFNPGYFHYGVMDPAIPPGFLSGISPYDMRTFRLIGWTINDYPKPITIRVVPTSGGSRVSISIYGYLLTNTSLCVFGEYPNQVSVAGVLDTSIYSGATWAKLVCTTPTYGTSSTLRISNGGVLSDALAFSFTGAASPAPSFKPTRFPTPAPTRSF